MPKGYIPRCFECGRELDYMEDELCEHCMRKAVKREISQNDASAPSKPPTKEWDKLQSQRRREATKKRELSSEED